MVRGGPEVRFRVRPGFQGSAASTKKSTACCWGYHLSFFFLGVMSMRVFFFWGGESAAGRLLWGGLRREQGANMRGKHMCQAMSSGARGYPPRVHGASPNSSAKGKRYAYRNPTTIPSHLAMRSHRRCWLRTGTDVKETLVFGD